MDLARGIRALCLAHVDRVQWHFAPKIGTRYLLPAKTVPGTSFQPHHLDNRASIQRYRRKADEVAAIVGTGRILDWGCGFGQMTFLLERRGLSVVPFDIESSRRPHTLCYWVGRAPEYASDFIRLPFSAGGFDAVLSSGTLEHVADPDASLKEIHRILRPGGYFIIYNLPNRYSWIEWLGFLRGTAHERRYSLGQVRAWLRDKGFDVLVGRHDNVFPCTFNGVPSRLRTMLMAINGPFAKLDEFLSCIPVVSRVGTNLTFICRRA